MPYKPAYAHALVSRVYGSDEATDLITTLKESGEPLIPNLSNDQWPKKLDINELWDVNLQKYAFQLEYLDRKSVV